MKKRRAWWTVVLLCLLLTAAGCGNTEQEQGTAGTATPTTAAQDGEGTDGSGAVDDGAADSGAAGGSGEAGAETEIEPTVTPELDEMRDITSAELVSELKIGWCLGNTLDATGGIGIMSETAWGQPRTKKEMITAVKDAGFSAIRIPTTWYPHSGGAPEHKLHDVWLERVKEVVDYAYEQDMYIILNLHHEEWIYPDEAHYEQNKAQLTAYWTQIANYFIAYDEHLIFEGMNEPRLIGSSYEWNGGTEEARKVVNQLNADFVAAVRATGGNNTLRHLMTPTYAASSDAKAMKDYVKPEDDNIIVSVHAYTPVNFALMKNGTAAFDATKEADMRDINSLFANLDTYFLSQGLPVILGEFGAMSKDNLEARVSWAEAYVSTATAYGIPCFVWDNHAFTGNGELFGLLNRRTLTWEFPEVIEAFMRGLETE